MLELYIDSRGYGVKNLMSYVLDLVCLTSLSSNVSQHDSVHVRHQTVGYCFVISLVSFSVGVVVGVLVTIAIVIVAFVLIIVHIKKSRNKVGVIHKFIK